MAKLADITGQRFGRLKVLQKTEKPNGIKSTGSYWKCECDCGNIVIISGRNLRYGDSNSCGCLQKELLSIRKSKTNQYDLSGEYGIGYTSKGEEFYFDLEDYDKIKNYCWSYGNEGYITARDDKQTIKMHRVILNMQENKPVDHINRKRYDNRKNNLRICTSQQNSFNMSTQKRNKSGCKGVRYDKEREKWCATIGLNRKNIFLGRFTKLEDAISARLNAEKKYYGEYSIYTPVTLNQILERRKNIKKI